MKRNMHNGRMLSNEGQSVSDRKVFVSGPVSDDETSLSTALAMYKALTGKDATPGEIEQCKKIIADSTSAK